MFLLSGVEPRFELGGCHPCMCGAPMPSGVEIQDKGIILVGFFALFTLVLFPWVSTPETLGLSPIFPVQQLQHQVVFRRLGVRCTTLLAFCTLRWILKPFIKGVHYNTQQIEGGSEVVAAWWCGWHKRAKHKKQKGRRQHSTTKENQASSITFPSCCVSYFPCPGLFGAAKSVQWNCCISSVVFLQC